MRIIGIINENDLEKRICQGLIDISNKFQTIYTCQSDVPKSVQHETVQLVTNYRKQIPNPILVHNRNYLLIVHSNGLLS